MSEKEYKCWCPDVGETEAEATLHVGYDAECAACEHAEQTENFSAEYCKEWTIEVVDWAGNRTTWGVVGEQTITYSATLVSPTS